MEWLKPYTDDTIERWEIKGSKRCARSRFHSFRNIETLGNRPRVQRLAEENRIEYGVRHRLMTVFIDDLANAVVEALPANAIAALSDITTNISNNANLASNMDGSEIVRPKARSKSLSATRQLRPRIPTREFMYEADDVLPFVAVAAFCLFLGIQVRLGMEGIFVPGGGLFRRFAVRQ